MEYKVSVCFPLKSTLQCAISWKVRNFETSYKILIAMVSENISHYARLLEQQRQYFHSGKTLSVDFRKLQLKKLYHSIQTYEMDIMQALFSDLGKSFQESYATEIGMVLGEITHALKNLSQWTKPCRVKTPLTHFGSKSSIYYDPFGVCLIISPWNYPINLTLIPLIGAIAGGNTAIVKPSEHSSATLRVLKTMLSEIFPPEYIAIATGDADLSALLTTMPFDFIFFTGGTHIGRKVMKAASERLTPLLLELGGKSPAIITSSADLFLAAKRLVWAKATNAGQTCVAPDYLMIHKTQWRKFIPLLKQAIEEQYPPTPMQSDIYPKIISKQHFHRLTSLLEEQEIVIGGKTDARQQKIDFTVLYPVSPTSLIMQEEIFGPILPVFLFEKREEVAEFIRQRPKPLALYLFSNDKSEQKYFLKYLSFGGGCVNDAVYHLGNLFLPFGGVGESGRGAYHGKQSFYAFTHAKSVLHQTNKFDISMRYYTHIKNLKLLKWLLK